MSLPPTSSLVACRKGDSPVPPYLKLELRCLRPSLGDSRFTADAWIVDEGNGSLVLRLGDYNLAQIAALPFDVPGLNQMLERVWSRRQRWRR